MGWTTANEAAVPILSAKHTHEGLRDTPIIDRTCCVLMANNEIVLDLLENGEYERAKQVVGWCVWAAKAFGIKAVNPGGVAGWKWEGLQGVVRCRTGLQEGHAREDDRRGWHRLPMS